MSQADRETFHNLQTTNLAADKNIEFPVRLLEYGLLYYLNVKKFGFKPGERDALSPPIGTLAYTIREKVFHTVYEYVRPILAQKHRLKLLTIFDTMKRELDGVALAREVTLLISLMADIYTNCSLEARILLIEFLRRYLLHFITPFFMFNNFLLNQLRNFLDD